MSTLVRFEDWPCRIQAVINNMRNLEFVWGQHDCCLMGANIIQAYTGTDIAASWRGRYSTFETAQEYLASRGCASVADLAELMALEYAMEEVPIKMAQRGDPILFNGHTGPTIGICVGYQLVAPGRYGAMFVNMHTIWADETAKAWRI